MSAITFNVQDVVFWAAYVPCDSQHKDAVQLTLEQIDVIRRLTEQYHPRLTLCTSSEDIKSAHKQQQMCSLIGVEGGHSLADSLAVLRTLYHMVIKEMNRIGMIVDLSHVSVHTMHDALEVSKAPVIFSHSSAHALCNSTRNVPDDTLRKLALNRGVIMVNFYSLFLTCREVSTIADAVELIGTGKWTVDDLKKLAGLNFLRVFQEVEKIRDEFRRANVPPYEEVITPRPKDNNCTSQLV
ncbi:unnamed protein product [Acanthoscelides obtectus]|uniref:Dipeptidase n=1 Tax=Acanthoscelides obtectus TaxID=200917 RepID=A0A9P0M0M9_ACAOB|nr:unnamed protein product [Acanthoscelides obtectus]CAK1651547.1 Dipeptidase 1 [Acanthoscelides obtectus]